MIGVKLVKTINKGSERMALCMSAPDSGKCLPQDKIIVIDKSGSMSSDATPGLPESERDGISILNLIIHCIKVLIKCLDSEDRICIICFDEEAKEYQPMTYMTDANKEALLLKMTLMQTGGGTKIWSGIKTGLDTLKNCFQENVFRNQSMMVFTDGLDVSKPVRGNMYELDSFISANFAWTKNITMDTVGFGRDLDSKELFEMSERLNGTFSHIPESSTAGTILINRSATDICTYGKNISVIVSMKDGTVSKSNIGSICVGQNRTHPIGQSLNDIEKIEVSMFNGSSHVLSQVDLTTVTEDQPTVLACWVKFDLVETIKHIINNIQTTSPTLSLPYSTQQFANFRKRNEENSLIHPYIQSCLEDVDDQLRKAVEKEKWCAMWGLHYLRSYLHATRNEIVNNFRDKGIQHFASSTFTTWQTRCEKIFLNAPPIPKKIPVSRASNIPTATLNPVIDTTVYSERYYSGSCFHPNSLILMADGVAKPVGKVRKGDLVFCGDDRVASVRCVTFSTGLFEMVDIDGFSLTSTHPIRSSSSENEWVYPKDISSNRSDYEEEVINFLLDAHHEIVGVSPQLLTPIRCCTLGHGLKGSIIEHDYLGTDKVVRDLEQIPEFNSGLVYVSFTRENEYISGIRI
jgi:hypothetical protein